MKVFGSKPSALARASSRMCPSQQVTPFAELLFKPTPQLTPCSTPPRFEARTRQWIESAPNENTALLSPSEAVADDELDDGVRCSLDEDRRLDPMARHLASAMGIATSPTIAVEATDGWAERLDLVRTQTLEQLFPALVRRAAWHIAADRRSGTLHLEIGSGVFDGTTVLIRADPNEVRIELDAPPEIDLDAWKSRLRHRLASHGLVAHIS